MNQSPGSGIRFRPASKKAFSQYAKALAWLLQKPLSRAQEILARTYGEVFTSSSRRWRRKALPAPTRIPHQVKSIPRATNGFWPLSLKRIIWMSRAYLLDFVAYASWTFSCIPSLVATPIENCSSGIWMKA
jgi:hypothetical protein